MRKITLKVPTGTSTIEIDAVTMDYKFFNIYGERLFNSTVELNAPEFTPEQKEAFKKAFYEAGGKHIQQSGRGMQVVPSGKPFVLRDYAAKFDTYAKLTGRKYDPETQAMIECNWTAIWNKVAEARKAITHFENRFNTVL